MFTYLSSFRHLSFDWLKRCFTSTETVRLIRDGKKGEGVRRFGGGAGGGRLYLSLHCHHQYDLCIKVGMQR